MRFRPPVVIWQKIVAHQWTRVEKERVSRAKEEGVSRVDPKVEKGVWAEERTVSKEEVEKAKDLENVLDHH